MPFTPSLTARLIAAMVMALVPAMIAIARCPAADTSWSGTIEIVESISGTPKEGPDREELDELFKIIEMRLAWARVNAAVAPATMAQTLREDIGFYEAERDRTLAARGGVVELGTTGYLIRGQRIAVTTIDGRLVADRGAGTAVITGAGRRVDATLAALPAPLPLPNDHGPLVMDRPTRQFALKIDGHPAVALVAPDLPNPYALALIDRAGDDEGSDETAITLAALPGLPMQIEIDTGTVKRRRTVTAITPREVAEFELRSP